MQGGTPKTAGLQLNCGSGHIDQPGVPFTEPSMPGFLLLEVNKQRFPEGRSSRAARDTPHTSHHPQSSSQGQPGTPLTQAALQSRLQNPNRITPAEAARDTAATSLRMREQLVRASGINTSQASSLVHIISDPEWSDPRRQGQGQPWALHVASG